MVPAVFEIELKRALSEPEPKVAPAFPGEPVDNRAVFDPEGRLNPKEWAEFDAVLSALDKLPEMERTGAMSFKERRRTEERLLDQLDQWCELIAKRRGK